MAQSIFTREPVDYVGAINKIPSFLPQVSSTRQSGLVGYLNRHPDLKQWLKSYLKPLVALLDYRSTLIYWFVDGYIQRSIGYFIRRYVKKGVVLEIGMGGGKLLKYLDLAKVTYYGFDIYDISSVGIGRSVKIFIASAEDIPLPDSNIDYIVATEVFEHIANFQKTFREMHRVIKNKGKLIVSIPNLYSMKHIVKDPQLDNINKWHYQEFIDQLSPYFRLLEGRMNGYWTGIFSKIRYSIQIPYSHSDEYYNCNFFYVFEAVK